MIREFNIDRLKVHVYEDKHALGEAAAKAAELHINQAIERKGEAVVILATGASQFEFLEALCKKQIDWSKVTAFHLDEYVGMSVEHPASFRRYLLDRIINKVRIGKYYLLQGDADDVEEECQRVHKLLNENEVDVAFVGIGENGHLAFNDPPASFDDKVNYKVVDLDEHCRRQQLGEGWFSSLDEVPTQAISMTIPAIMKSKAIICSVPDRRKAQAVKNTLTGEITPDVPASILRQHSNCTLFLDQESASLITLD